MTVDPSSFRVEVAEWVPDNLTEAEANVYRVAYRQPLVGFPLDPWWTQAECFPLDIPACLRLLPDPSVLIEGVA